MVDKTFVDAKGYMVTKKEMVSCSETDDEEQEGQGGKKKAKMESSQEEQKDVAEKIKGAGKRSKNALGNSQNKQASIMSFFKRKND